MEGAVTSCRKAWSVQDMSIAWAYRPVSFLSIAGGMAPYTSDPDSRRPFDKHCRRWPSAVVTLVIISYFVICCFVSLPEEWRGLLYDDADSTTLCNEAVMYAAELLFPIVTFILMQPKSRVVPKLIHRFCNIEPGLLSVESTNRKLRKYSCVLVACAVLLTCVAFASWTGTYTEIAAVADINMGDVSLVLLIVHSSLIINIPMMQVVFFALALKAHFREVNSRVRALRRHILSRHGEKLGWEKELKSACKTFVELYEVTGEIGKIYGYVVTVRYAAFLSNIISTLYYYAFSAAANSGTFDKWANVVYICVQIVTLVMVTVILGGIPTETTKSIGDLTRISTSAETTWTHHVYVNSMMRLMLGPPIQITASHFFEVTSGLVTSILGTITTYFIILAQFKRGETEM